MNLFVTGGAGFIGANFILYWMKQHPDDHIVNFDLLTYAGNLENLKDIEGNGNYRFIRGDIRNPEEVAKAMEGADFVVHFAAESHVDRSILEPAAFVSTNVLGTQVLLEQAQKLGIKRFHHVSTDEVFGALPLETSEKFSENTRYNPRSPYSASKASSDHFVRAYFHTYGMPITITNCSNNYGPYQFPEKFIPLAITNIMENKSVPVYGDGLYVRDWLYVEDHCRAIESVLLHGVVGETYCVGGVTEDISNVDVLRKIFRIMGKDESLLTFSKDRPGHDRRYAVDWTKIHDELGWVPQYDFDTWLEKTVIWYQTHTSWWQRIKSGAYQAYYQQQYGGKAA